MPILPNLQEKIQEQILPLVPAKWTPMMQLGINALSLRPFVSLNTNAKSGRDNEVAAQRQMYRLLGHPKLIGLFSSLLLAFFSIDAHSVIAMDFTIEGAFAMLCLALQTREGRAIPIWVDVLEYPVLDEGSQNLFILDVVREFQAVVGCTFTLVCDRGFIGDQLIRGFLDLGLTFIIRMKAGKHWTIRGKSHSLRTQHKLDETGVMYGEILRVVRSSRTLQHQLKEKEPWYIITNDFDMPREGILTIYAHRFEIEETFKDLKHLFDFIPTGFIKKQSVLTVFWFAILGFWLLWQMSRDPELLHQRLSSHIKKRISWVRQLFELLHKELQQLIFPEPSHRKEVSLA